ncbi:hypothetical protein C4J93_2180 [Pseudomonas sp. R2-37-08W]|nr:hypothetical protein C4J93_2180 [Pseudomonas sp. R2-37-08W]
MGTQSSQKSLELNVMQEELTWMLCLGKLRLWVGLC